MKEHRSQSSPQSLSFDRSGGHCQGQASQPLCLRAIYATGPLNPLPVRPSRPALCLRALLTPASTLSHTHPGQRATGNLVFPVLGPGPRPEGNSKTSLYMINQRRANSHLEGSHPAHPKDPGYPGPALPAGCVTLGPEVPAPTGRVGQDAWRRQPLCELIIQPSRLYFHTHKKIPYF